MVRVDKQLAQNVSAKFRLHPVQSDTIIMRLKWQLLASNEN